MSEQKREFSANVQAVLEDFLAIAHRFAEGRGKYAISVGGSQGKGLSDQNSDVDFRLFIERDLVSPEENPQLWQDYYDAMEYWRQRGINVDGIWTRRIDTMDALLDRWLAGELATIDMIWTIWGYHLLPDLYHQAVIEDPFGVIAGWKERLRVYPQPLKQAILKKHLESLRYWRGDYHYRNKVQRGDVVFTAGLTSRLVHDMIQVLFALNETYYVGDGQNLDFCRKFALAPAGFADKVQQILYPEATENRLQVQYAALLALIDEVVALADQNARQ